MQTHCIRKYDFFVGDYVFLYEEILLLLNNVEFVAKIIISLLFCFGFCELRLNNYSC